MTRKKMIKEIRENNTTPEDFAAPKWQPGLRITPGRQPTSIRHINFHIIL